VVEVRGGPVSSMPRISNTFKRRWRNLKASNAARSCDDSSGSVGRVAVRDQSLGGLSVRDRDGASDGVDDGDPADGGEYAAISLGVLMLRLAAEIIPAQACGGGRRRRCRLRVYRAAIERLVPPSDPLVGPRSENRLSRPHRSADQSDVEQLPRLPDGRETGAAVVRAYLRMKMLGSLEGAGMIPRG
jgi:hypothetical protein